MLINFKYQKFSLRVMLSFCFIFCHFQPGVSYYFIITSLLTAKCRLNPNKDHNIPRLELLASLLLSFHMNTVLESVSKKIEIHRIYCWNDSQISLWWIKQQTKTWKICIQNRVNKMSTFFPLNSWKFVRANENPVDNSTRHTKPDALLSKILWKKGPF